MRRLQNVLDQRRSMTLLGRVPFCLKVVSYGELYLLIELEIYFYMALQVLAKQLWQGLLQGLDEAVGIADKDMLDSFSSEDFKEGVAHFIEKRAHCFRMFTQSNDSQRSIEFTSKLGIKAGKIHECCGPAKIRIAIMIAAPTKAVSYTHLTLPTICSV